MICLLAVLWCTFDRAGRSWVKLKVSKKQEAIRRSKSRVERRMSRAKQTQELYEANWDRRFRFLCCCAGVGDAQQNSFAEVAKLFSEFFHELDVVPSDIIAGFMLLREEQKRRRKLIVANQGNNIYEFLSGVPITPQTQHLNLTDPVSYDFYQDVLYYFKFAIAAYGWPLYMIMNKTTGLCKLARHCRCCCCNLKNSAEVVDQDNCCQCNFTALKRQLGLPESDIVYATFHSAVSETPFFVVIDHEHHKVVISVRGTLSLQDCLTDLSADISQLPVDGMPDDWLGHKGMVEAAMYIKRKLKDEFILARAFGHDKERGTHTYDLVLVGHSLGAGTAAILAILLKPEFPSLYCYAYSPPGGLLSMSVVEHTKDFITSVVVGKDIVIRIGLAQMEYMRSDLISCIKRSQDPKWLIISGGLFCCCNIRDVNMQPSTGQEDFSPSPTRVDVAAHPSDLSILLSTHVPLYPPGKIMHIVRNHPNNVGCLTNPTVYHALWVENTSFDEVLVSPVMLNDHLPYNVQDALEKCLLHAEQGKVALEIHTEVSESCSEIYMNQHNSNNVGQNDNDCDDTLRNGYQDPDRRTVSTMSWDYPHPDDKEVNEHLRRPDQYVDRHSGKHSSEVSNDMESSYNGDWLSKAPLARPESLSESSSMYSVVSESRKSSSFTTRSGRPHRTEGYCYYVDPVDSPEEAYGKAFAAGPYSRNQITTLATIEGTPTHFATSASPVHTQRGLSSGTDHANDSAQTVQSSDSGVVTTGEEIPLTVLNRPLPEGSPPPKPPRLSQAKMIQENPSKGRLQIKDKRFNTNFNELLE
ncbi:diacylglycerol lipase-alpha-like [Glandiceps talaboti]